MKRAFISLALMSMFAATPFTGSPALALGNASGTESGMQNYCTRFGTLSQKYEQNVSKQITNLQTRIQTQSDKVKTNRQDSDGTLAQHRQQWSQNRQNLYARLNGRAKTDAQKQAVTAFQSAVETAVAAREQAVDAARSAYRQTADQLISQHRTAVEQVLNAFQSAIQSAVGQAQASCTQGTNSTQVRSSFQQALKVARQTRATGIQDVDKIGPQLEQLAHTRNAAIQQAMTTYQNALHAAIAALRQAFGESAVSPSATPNQAATTTPSAT